ncbi:hypothetical protein [Enterococcus camelliae]|uniref:HhH-GPD domain-containing protein n=1 Tax=Enterococcus camelliae TaxID=453959 RepID=A0ABW5TIA4_9ENTE
MGPQGWWPGESKPEIILGAILVQNTNWLNVTKSLENLKTATNFIPEAICQLQREELETLIRPSGFYKNKARAIETVFHWFDQQAWDYEKIKQKYGRHLRSQLLIS